MQGEGVGSGEWGMGEKTGLDFRLLTPIRLFPIPHSPFPTPHSPLPTPHSPLPTPHSPLPTPHSPLPTLAPPNRLCYGSPRRLNYNHSNPYSIAQRTLRRPSAKETLYCEEGL